MQQQERDLISGLFDRLKPFESQPRDAEADTFIRGLAGQQPAAAYLLVQTVLVQEQALKAAQERIAELEAKAAAAPPAATGFLSSAPRIGPWGAAAAAPASEASRGSVPSTVPSTRSPLQAALSPQQPPQPQQPPAGGGFLRTAMATAAGVAGGALLFEGIRGLMGSNPFGQPQAAMGGTTPPELLPPDTASQQQQAYADDQGGAAPEDYDTAAVDDGGFGGDDDSWA